MMRASSGTENVMLWSRLRTGVRLLERKVEYERPVSDADKLLPPSPSLEGYLVRPLSPDEARELLKATRKAR